jgi:hypothetical protein
MVIKYNKVFKRGFCLKTIKRGVHSNGLWLYLECSAVRLFFRHML